MLVLVKLFGIVIVVMGIIFLVNPNALKQYVEFWRKKKKLQRGAILAVICGIVFLIAAPQCRLSGFITILGIWSIIKGILLLTLPQKKLYAYLDWWVNGPVSATRFPGFFALAIGVLIVYSV